VKPKIIGLIVNPRSGPGAARNLEVARLLAQALEPEHVYTGPGLLGGDALPKARVLPVEGLTGRAASQAVARMAVEQGVEALVVIGGDGTMADIAFAVHQAGVRCPIMGIGAGSINAGDLVTCRAGQVEELATADFAVETITALEASCNDNVLAFGFNDIVIGTTIVGTEQGSLCDLDANAALEGRRVLAVPRSVGRQTAVVIKRSGDARLLVSAGMAVGTVIAGFTHYDCFFGKAIVGAVCLSSLVGIPAGCLVCEQPLVRTQLDRQAHLAMEPVHSAYVGLAEGEVIEVTGLAFPAVLCADGNPLKALQPADVARLCVRPDAVDVLRIIRQD